MLPWQLLLLFLSLLLQQHLLVLQLLLVTFLQLLLGQLAGLWQVTAQYHQPLAEQRHPFCSLLYVWVSLRAGWRLLLNVHVLLTQA